MDKEYLSKTLDALEKARAANKRISIEHEERIRNERFKGGIEVDVFFVIVILFLILPIIFR
jgi:hypothetical protein